MQTTCYLCAVLRFAGLCRAVLGVLCWAGLSTVLYTHYKVFVGYFTRYTWHVAGYPVNCQRYLETSRVAGEPISYDCLLWSGIAGRNTMLCDHKAEAGRKGSREAKITDMTANKRFHAFRESILLHV